MKASKLFLLNCFFEIMPFFIKFHKSYASITKVILEQTKFDSLERLFFVSSKTLALKN